MNSAGFGALWDKEGRELQGVGMGMNGTHPSPSSFQSVGEMMLLQSLFQRQRRIRFLLVRKKLVH